MKEAARIEVLPLGPDRLRDFYQVHSRANNADWCYCTAWWVPTWEGWGDRTQAENRSLREELFARGQFDGYLLYADGKATGWCQVGPRDRLQKLCQAYQFSPNPGIWAITCFLLSPARRGQGLARLMLQEVLEDLGRRGVTFVQAYPRKGEGLSAGEVWTGTPALVRAAGFTMIQDDPRRPVYQWERPEP
jgi:GNAT superfamily N-acetyltransferase